MNECKWTHKYDDENNVWYTQCSEAWELNEGSPHENGMKFCCYCGQPLVQEINRVVELEDE
jgi:hypothetical protein